MSAPNSKKSYSAADLDKLLKGRHGGLFFSPSKGFHCDVLAHDESWVHGTGKTLKRAVDDAFKKLERVKIEATRAKTSRTKARTSKKLSKPVKKRSPPPPPTTHR